MKHVFLHFTLTLLESYSEFRWVVFFIQRPPFFCLFSSGSGVGGEKHQIKIWHICHHFLNICTWNYFTSLAKAGNCAGKHRKSDVTTVFAYSPLNTPIDQWERAYYLEYFMISNNRQINSQSLPFSLNSLSPSQDLTCHLLSCATLLPVSQLTKICVRLLSPLKLTPNGKPSYHTFYSLLMQSNTSSTIQNGCPGQIKIVQICRIAG